MSVAMNDANRASLARLKRIFSTFSRWIVFMA
jgi:hypothetical protein